MTESKNAEGEVLRKIEESKITDDAGTVTESVVATDNVANIVSEAKRESYTDGTVTESSAVTQDGVRTEGTVTTLTTGEKNITNHDH